jgi:ribosomal subunit interface protein
MAILPRISSQQVSRELTAVDGIVRRAHIQWAKPKFMGPMQIKVTGKNLDIGAAMRSHVEDSLRDLAAKYFSGTVSAHVTVEKQRAQFVTDCTLHLATGLVLQAHGKSGDAFKSFDKTASHLEKQLRRYKQRLKDHHDSRTEPVRQRAAANYVIAASKGDGDGEPKDLNPVIIAENSSDVPELSVGEAVMQLDISTVAFVLFRNARDGGLNVVYRRDDGNIGWIDPRPNSSS